MKRQLDDFSSFVQPGGEFHLSNLGQLELLRATVERGIPLRIRVRGFSMAPFIRDDDVLTIAPFNGRAPRVGEVVAFVRRDTGRLAIHRLIGARNGAWLACGDNNREPDGVVRREDLLGRVARVERDGHDVRLGLGAERVLIALLQRANALRRAVYLVGRIRRIPMSIRITLARRLISLGRLVQSLALMVMKPRRVHGGRFPCHVSPHR